MSKLTTPSSIVAYVIIIWLATGCLSGPNFLSQGDDAKQIDAAGQVNASIVTSENGVVTGALTADASTTQVLEAAGDSNIAGAAVAFPPGSLAINTNVTIEEGASLASDSVAEELGLGGASLSAASSAVVVSAADEINALQPFTVAIGLSGASLTQQDTSRMIVVYRVKKAGEGYFTGVIPNTQLTFEGNAVKFQTQFFGSFQVVVTDVAIEAPKEVATTTQVTTKRDEVMLPEAVKLQIVQTTTQSIKIIWLSGGGATSYFVIAHREGAAPTHCGAAQHKATDLNRTELNITGLAASKSYGIRICAVDANGRMSAGIVVTARTMEATTGLDPFAITGFPVLGPSQRFPLSKDLKFTWSPSANAVDYEVSVTFDQACKSPLDSIRVVTTNSIDDDLNDVPDGPAFLCVTARRGTQRLTAPSYPVDIYRAVLHVAYMKQAGANSEARYATVKTGSVDVITIDNGSTTNSDNIRPKMDIAIDPMGNAYVAYLKDTSPDGPYAWLTRISSGIPETPQQIEIWAYSASVVTTGIDQIVTAVAISGTITTRDGGFPGTSADSYSASADDDLDIVVDADGGMHASYVLSGSAYYGHFKDGAPQTMLNLNSAVGFCTETFSPSITLDATGKPAIAFICKKSGPTCHVFTGTRNAADTAFDFYDHGTTQSGASCYNYAFDRMKPSLARAPNGLMSVAYFDAVNAKLMLATGSGNVWARVTILEGSTIYGVPTLTYDMRGRAHVFYLEDNSGNYILNLISQHPGASSFSNTPLVIDTNISGMAGAAVTGVPGSSTWAPPMPPILN